MDWGSALIGGAATVCLGAIAGAVAKGRRRQEQPTSLDNRPLIRPLIENHFRPVTTDNITISERKFPFRVRADLQRAIDRLFAAGTTSPTSVALRRITAATGSSSTHLLVDSHSPALSVPPQYEEVDIGEAEPVRCLKNGLWLLNDGDNKYVVLLCPAGYYGQPPASSSRSPRPTAKRERGLPSHSSSTWKTSVLKAESYRGKVLSLELGETFVLGRIHGDQGPPAPHRQSGSSYSTQEDPGIVGA